MRKLTSTTLIPGLIFLAARPIMQELRFHGQRDLSLQEQTLRPLKGDEVLMKVTDAGLSQTQLTEFIEGPYIIAKDLHPLTGFEGPLVPCQEFGGEIVELGPDAPRGLLGKQVAALPLIHCGTCDHCRAGRENLCTQLAYRGLIGADGGFASFCILAADQVLEEPDKDKLTFIEPILVAIHAAKRLGPTLHPDAQVLVLGAGGVGLALAAVWRDFYGAKVSVHDPVAPRLERATAMGIQTVADPDASVAAADIVVDAAGRNTFTQDQAITFALQRAKPGATIVAIGCYFIQLEFVPMELVVTERNLIPSFAYDLSDVEDLRRKRPQLKADFSPLIKTIPLDRIVEDGYFATELDNAPVSRFVAIPS